MMQRAVKADENLHEKVVSCRKDKVTKFFRGLTCLGSLTFGTLLTAALYRTGNRKIGKKLLLGSLSSRIVANLLKLRLKRARPQDKLVKTRTHSFPSGHTATAFATATVLDRQTDIPSGFLHGLAGLVGVSRIYLGAHYFSDVAVGSVIGKISGRLASY